MEKLLKIGTGELFLLVFKRRIEDSFMAEVIVFGHLCLTLVSGSILLVKVVGEVI